MEYLVDLFIQAVEVDTDKPPGSYLCNLLCNPGISERDTARPDVVDEPQLLCSTGKLIPVLPHERVSPEPVDCPDSRFLYLVQDTVNAGRGKFSREGIPGGCITVLAASRTGKAGFDLYCIDLVFFKKPDDFCMVRMKTPVGDDRTGISRDRCTAHECRFRSFFCR
jgi:hypothetical protein